MNITYIPDKEINLNEENDLLGTITHVETLSEIIDKCSTPFTIGLLGGWGSGKSSIIKTIQGRFNGDESKGIKVFNYDAWKYSKDSFRRTFILELKNFFNLDTTEVFKTFYQDKNEDIEHSLILNNNFVLYLLVLCPLLLLFVWLLKDIGTDEKIFTTIISLVFTAILFILKESFIPYKVSISKPRTFAPEQFEEIFKEIIQEVTSKPRNLIKWITHVFLNRSLKKIVIVIDNIDRCDHEVAIELLLSVKNFLELENVVFVIPVDEDGLKNYLKIPNQDANEFLRKLFNTNIRLKSFSDIELYDFAHNLVQKYRIDIPNEVISIICQEFSTNPRRIIQFLNTFQTEMLLAERQELRGLIPNGVITKNLAVLAKISIIREEWPDLWKIISDDPSMLQKINDGFREKQYEFNESTGIWSSKNKGIKIRINEQCFRFLMRTHQFEAVDLEPFLLNKDVHVGIPDEIKRLVESQDLERIKILIEENKISIESLLNFTSDKIDRDVVKNKLFSTSGFNILSLIFKLASDDNYKDNLDNIFSGKALGRIKLLTTMGEMRDRILDFNANDLCNFAQWLDSKGFDSLVSCIISVINTTNIENVEYPSVDKSNPVLKEKLYKTTVSFINAFNHKPNYLRRIRDKFSNILVQDLNNEDLLSILRNKASAGELLRDNIIESIINELQQDYNTEPVRKSVLFLQYLHTNKILSEELQLQYLNKAISFTNSNDYNQMHYWYNALSGFINSAKNQTAVINNIYSTFNRDHNRLYANYVNNPQQTDLNVKTYQIFLDCAKELFFITEPGYDNDGNILSWIMQFFQSDKVSDVYLYANKILSEIVEEFNNYSWPFADIVINRFKSIGNWEHKKEISRTINLMLQNTNVDYGLNKNQIIEILDYYLEMFFSNNEEQTSASRIWLLEMAKNKYVSETMLSKFAFIQDISEQIMVLDIIKELGDNDFLDKIIGAIIISTSDDRLISIIDEFESKYGISENSVAKLIDEKLKSLLGSPQPENQLIAIHAIDKLKNIPADDVDVLKTLLDDLDEERYDDDQKRLLSNVRARLLH